MGSPLVNIDPRIEEMRRRQMMQNSPMNTGGLMLPPMDNAQAPVNPFTVGMDTGAMPVTPMPPVPVGNPFVTGIVNPDINRNVPMQRPPSTLMPGGSIPLQGNGVTRPVYNAPRQPLVAKPSIQSNWQRNQNQSPVSTTAPTTRPGTGIGGLAPRKPMSMSTGGQQIEQNRERRRSLFSPGTL